MMCCYKKIIPVYWLSTKWCELLSVNTWSLYPFYYCAPYLCAVFPWTFICYIFYIFYFYISLDFYIGIIFFSLTCSKVFQYIIKVASLILLRPIPHSTVFIYIKTLLACIFRHVQHLHWKKKWSQFDLISWVTGGTSVVLV